jgi:hypothetical protein
VRLGSSEQSVHSAGDPQLQKASLLPRPDNP